MPDPTVFTLEADFDFTGTYETDLSAYADRGFSINRMMGDDGGPRVGTATIDLNNHDGRFTPNYSAGPYYGQLVQDVPIRLKGFYNAITYVLFTGYASDWVPSFSGVQNRCSLTLHDLWLYFVEGAPINVATSTTRDTDGALDAIFDEMGLLAADQTFDDGIQDLPLHFALNQNPAAAVMDVVKSEMGGFAHILADGTMKFQSRQARLGATPDDTWGDGTNIVPDHVSVSQRMDNVVHAVTVIPTLFTTGQADQVMFSDIRNMYTKPTADSFFLTANQVFVDVYDLDAPITALTALEAVVDYLANSAANGTGTDLTSSLNPTVENLGAAIRRTYKPTSNMYVTKFQVRGTPAPFSGQRPRFERTKAQSSARAPRGVEVVVPFGSDEAATRNYPEQLMRTNRWPWPMLDLQFKWVNADITAAMQAVEIGDLIQFADEATGLGVEWVSQVNDLWYVEGIRHVVRMRAAEVTEIRLVPSYLFSNLDAITFDTFNRANASGDLGVSSSGDTWLNDGNFDIASNAATPNNIAEQHPNIDLGSANMIVEASLSNLAADTDEECGVCFRGGTTVSADTWRFYVDDGSNQYVLEKEIASVITGVATAVWTPADTAELRVICQANRIRCYDGVKLVIDATDASMNANTKVGLYTKDTTEIVVDDFTARGI